MPSTTGDSAGTHSTRVNIAEKLRDSARRSPTQRAVVFPAGRDRQGRVTYSHLTFHQLDQESDRLARGLRQLGVEPGSRMVLMVRPSLEFIALTFALFKAGAVVVLIDPGMGRTGIFNCLEQVQPEGFIAIPIVQAIRSASNRFKLARLNVTVGGRRWFWGGPDYATLLGPAWEPFEIAHTHTHSPAAIIFTSGSTGPPKGVLYEHGMFAAQVELLREFYDIRPGEVDLPGFPLFALFNSAMGVTTVIPDMDPTRPARVDPARILEAVENQGVTQAFGSPAIWNRVGRYCVAEHKTLPTLRRVLSAGAPVPIPVIERMLQCLTTNSTPTENPIRGHAVSEDATTDGTLPDIHTPYGATEALPVCSIGGREIVRDTAPLTRVGKGTCVGRPFPQMEVRIIEITHGPIQHLERIHRLPPHQIGEIIVSGPVVTREYYQQSEATLLAKIPDGNRFWHRMGDVGYLDDQGRLWFCGRKAHVVETPAGRMFTICCEAIYNQHPRIFRSALVGVGTAPQQVPVIIVEPEAGQFPRQPADRQQLAAELRELGRANPLTASIEHILFHPSLPVDIRHNVKIFREKLAPRAAEQLRGQL